MSKDLVALSPESAGILDGLVVVREVLAPDLTMGELQLFALVSARSGLDPFAKQIYAVKRKGRMTIQTGIDGYRSIAARTGEYDGQDEPTYGPDCGCGKGSKHPESSTVKVYRKGMSRSVGATAFWHEYVPDAGQSGQGDVMWRKMPHVMLAKVAEALALRKAFPWDPTAKSGIGSDVYTAEEMAQADNVPPVAVQSVRDRVSARADAVGVVGVDLRYFAEAVSDIDPALIRAAREELFPEVPGVSGLTDEQRAVLLGRLTAPSEAPTDDGDPEEDVTSPPVEPVQEEEPGPIEGDGDETLPSSIVPSGACGDIARDPLMEGALCTRPKGHKSSHGNAEGSWPRK